MKDAIKMMKSNMSPEAIGRAHIKAEQDIMSIRLVQFREEINTDLIDLEKDMINTSMKTMWNELKKDIW